MKLHLLTFLAICSIPALAGPVSIFDGKTLDGWDANPALWRVEEGEIRGGSLTQHVRHNDFIATKKSYANFDLKLKLKLGGTGFVNSGVQIRSLRVPGSSEMSGYQVDYGPGWYGKLYDESRRNKVIADSKDPKAATAAVKEGDWNEYRIRTEGPRIQTWINGVPALDYTEPDPNIAQDGHIGIQIHGGGKAMIQAKDITIEELPATPDAPTWEKVGRPGEKRPKKVEPAPAGGPKGAKTPEEQRGLFKVPDGFEVQLVAGEIPEEGVGKFIAVYFDQKGAMWTMTALEYPVDGNENAAAAEALYKSKAKDKILVYDRDPKSPTGFVAKPRVFADGLAIPLGILPYKDGCYVQHGHDLVLLRDTDGDGKADKREVILTGLGVQDSHLFPHQFTRAPGGWIWMAQGLFNNSKVTKPGDTKAVDWPKCSMAKMRPDGSQFEVTSVGPNNIWGLALNGEGETFIQEANDYGYSVMPFHEYAYYPGGMKAFKKSYQPDFPALAKFQMGGTGLSGLALTDKDGIYPDPWRDVMLVANPITNKVQAIKMHRDGPRWRLEKLPDFVTTTDPWFRPVAMTLAPDGCVYIVDWYNKVISHNEVPRNHPDRDKTRGRIWRIQPKGKPLMEVPDFTKLGGDQLLAKLGGPSLAQSHLAWQAIIDRGVKDLVPKLAAIAGAAQDTPPARRIAALWALEGLTQAHPSLIEICAKLARDPNRNIRREAVRVIPELTDVHQKLNRIDPLRACIADTDPEVRAQVIRSAATMMVQNDTIHDDAFSILFSMVEAPGGAAAGNNAPAATLTPYERNFERFLIRKFLERNPADVARFLGSEMAKKLPAESRMFATLGLEPKTSAVLLAKILPGLQRPPEKEEVLRLVQFLDEPGVADAVKAMLASPTSAPGILAALLEFRTKVDPARLGPIVTDSALKLLASKDAAQLETGMQLAGAFKVAAAESALVNLARGAGGPGAIRALAEMGSADTALFAELAEKSPDQLIRDEALSALAASKAADAPQRVLVLYPKLAPPQRRSALDKLTTTKPGASAVVAAVTAGTLPKTEFDAATLDRLLAVLGDKDAALNALVESLGTLFRPVLALDGTDNALAETGVTLEGPLTIETWVKLAPSLGANDGIIGVEGVFDINFFQDQLRVWGGPGINDAVIARKKSVADMWNHIAAARDTSGKWKLYIDGELASADSRVTPQKIASPRIGYSNAAGGIQGQFAEYRIWSRERTADEIRANFDRGLPDGTAALVFNSSGKSGWGKLAAGAKVVKTGDLPPVLSAEQAALLDTKFAKYSALAAKPGDKERGKTAALVCQACHLFGNAGGQIGPNLSGVGAMGTEAILRNILTPNAAMESGYRIFRVEMRDGSLLDAFFVSEDRDAVVVRLPGAADRRIARKEILRTSFLRRSLMPEGMIEGMDNQTVSDLFAYLLSLK